MLSHMSYQSTHIDTYYGNSIKSVKHCYPIYIESVSTKLKVGHARFETGKSLTRLYSVYNHSQYLTLTQRGFIRAGTLLTSLWLTVAM